ncbi:hypothetical protein NADFUDRAFT_47217 [Nadsonia fulvescens var. elongata DSM 6958]|uniref:CTLH domain-containing protein n=1 Tax=Nadsonia fulvescens var. elongata DSM 6958 TaxID=857566 RepID=A0A1E3PGL8_9ASCO|nr:hypothetical protein NADFUDRAFT_47217 [Nadsonia fulvescens var. elongata DSM 6958]
MSTYNLNNANSSSSSSLASPKIYPEAAFNTRMNCVNITKSHLNDLIMNFLIIEGYQSTAETFSRETNMVPIIALNTIDNRMRIKKLILKGKIQESIELINDIHPELLDSDPNLHFNLLRLQLIELIREQFRKCQTNPLSENAEAISEGSPGQQQFDVEPILKFASVHLSKRASLNKEYLHELEKVMALVCFKSSDDKLLDALLELKDLLNLNLRKKIASEVNGVLLAYNGLNGEAKINRMIKLWGWSENLLKSENIVVPSLSKSDILPKKS